MSTRCWVPYCPTKASDGTALHRIPTAEEDRVHHKFWMKQARIKRPRKYKGSMFICGHHFKDIDYVEDGERKTLKRKKFPTLFQWSKEENVKYENNNSCNNTTGSSNGSNSLGNENLGLSDVIVLQEASDNEMTNSSDFVNSHDDMSDFSTLELFKNIRFLSTDHNIKYYTGFPTYYHLWTFYQLLEPDCSVSVRRKYRLPASRNGYDVILKPLTILEDLFMVLVRLRTALPEKIIEDLYNVKEGYLSTIFEAWVHFLAEKLQEFPIWLTQAQVRDAIESAQLSSNLHNVRVIIEYIELCVEDGPEETNNNNPNLNNNSLGAEPFRNKNGMKGITAIAPTGQITFFSGLYPNKCVDRKLLQFSGLIDNLEAGDVLMSNKVFGFEVDNELKAKQVESRLNVVPCDPSNKTNLQGSKGLIQIDGGCKSVKEFKILNGIVPHHLAHLLNSLWIICNHLVNFTRDIN